MIFPNQFTLFFILVLWYDIIVPCLACQSLATSSLEMINIQYDADNFHLIVFLTSDMQNETCSSLKKQNFFLFYAFAEFLIYENKNKWRTQMSSGKLDNLYFFIAHATLILFGCLII